MCKNRKFVRITGDKKNYRYRYLPIKFVKSGRKIKATIFYQDEKFVVKFKPEEVYNLYNFDYESFAGLDNDGFGEIGYVSSVKEIGLGVYDGMRIMSSEELSALFDKEAINCRLVGFLNDRDNIDYVAELY